MFDEISANFQKKHFLTAEEFFAIVIWKSNRAKTKVLKGIKEDGRTVEKLTKDVHQENDLEKKVEILNSVSGIGIPIASAVLTVCYPDIFTIVDYRASQTLNELGRNFKGDPTTSVSVYMEYVETCSQFAKKEGLSLRDTDRVLWGYDFYEGKDGLKNLVKQL